MYRRLNDENYFGTRSADSRAALVNVGTQQ
jgi:hypothetical protein